MKEFIRNIIVFFITLEAKLILKKNKPKVIVVTGSVGKTSTKDATYTAVRGHTFVRKSEKSYNSDIGVPLTVLGVPNGWANILQWLRNLIDGMLLLVVITPYPRWLIVEVGADRPGDISQSLAWLTPDVVIGTRFPDIPVHVEFYSSPEQVIKEEMFPFSQLSEGGIAVVSADDAQTRHLSLKGGVQKISYGISNDADVRASNIRILSRGGNPRGISFDVSYREEKARVTLEGVLGSAHRDATLAGIAGATAAGSSLQKAVEAFSEHTPPPGRLRIIQGLKKTTIIDDTYNSSPKATEVALEALSEAPGTRKIAVLGDMLELGSFSVSEHERIGVQVAKNADILLTVGVRAKGIAEGAMKAGMPESAVSVFERGADSASKLLSMLTAGDVILVKGSQSIRMERIVKSLMAEPEKAKDLLPRQDAEWLTRG
ncbi:hypothetical protein COU15_01120 [Candidatus Kaiserbacteria bacterium CG10_big_fil_rev_8_21_14_0_10_45_20]|uniref:UDP-N-acetylmuramoyl-tripeptide--D-alanyl-D-alanine ligase n=1 Tax=Candidatus Kaiserbacteria bacterium CG10_big_fil_rev_8_21_14_0_10_45_20 TaxID=1974607 RepID=A0A2H0UG76_9BACT|nr:MAG: hypothetical protein COU15_01120 [Candidatus Kaiserbacteria bacterium CG10_big_fil_rev_8_21_14_0_10_45_20]